jgi:hypothetical protein
MLARERIMEVLVLPNGRKHRVLARSPSGVAESEPEAPKNLRSDIVELQNAVLRGATSQRGHGSIALSRSGNDRIMEEFGARLHSFLFQGPIDALYRKSLDDAQAVGERLRLKLRVEAGRELARVPWEATYDVRTRTFMSCELHTLFTRAVDYPERTIRRPKQLHILGMIAGPTKFLGASLAPLDVDLERARIEAALAPLIEKEKATLAWTISGSYRDLRRRLRAPEAQDDGWTIFHFIGHGDFDEHEERGFLVFEESGSLAGEARYAETLGPLLTDVGGPQLVVLNACNGARSSSFDLFSSTAASLALAGVPAVLAMQFPVSDAMAIKFSSIFYDLLAEEGYSIQEALAQTRIELRGLRIAEWVSPVLYMQSSDGMVVL